MPNVTQRHATITVLSVVFVACCTLLVGDIVFPPIDAAVLFSTTLIGICSGGLLLLYRAGWDHARYAAATAILLLITYFIEEPLITSYASMTLMLPLAITLILTDWRWFLGSAVLLWLLMVWRAGGRGIYLDPITLLIYILIVISLVATRLTLETAIRQLKHQTADLQSLNQTLQASEQRYRLLVDSAADGIFVADMTGKYVDMNASACQMLGYTRDELLALSISDVVAPEDLKTTPLKIDLLKRGQRVVSERTLQRKDGSTFVSEISSVQLPNGRLQGIVRDISQRRALEASVRSHEKLLALTQNSIIDILFLIQVEADGVYRFVSVNDAFYKATALTPQQVIGQRVVDVIPPASHELVLSKYAEALRLNKIIKWEERSEYPAGVKYGEVTVMPILDDFTDVLYLFGVVHDITINKEAEQRLQHQVDRLRALHTIDVFIASSMNLQLTLNVVLDQVMNLMQVDAAGVLLLDKDTQRLEYIVSRGFRHPHLPHTYTRLGEGLAGTVAQHRQMLHLRDVQSSQQAKPLSNLMRQEEFVSYIAAPLITKGQVQGVLEIYQRTPHEPDAEWLSFLETLAGQTAIAVDSALLFQQLQESNAELSLAYDATIEGWARALDLRDKETEGHSRRVTDITVHIAQAMGVHSSELVHIRRGALLHDIGKMGVPDAILFKPAALDDNEWEIMQRHPQYAYDMLLPIQFLRPALDIPYAHHEKWDGTGYPRKLKGEQIPLAARIFALVDVWDALRSDRPYRAGWDEARVREHILNQSGKHFDPQVVECFLAVIGDFAHLYQAHP